MYLYEGFVMEKFHVFFFAFNIKMLSFFCNVQFLIENRCSFVKLQILLMIILIEDKYLNKQIFLNITYQLLKEIIKNIENCLLEKIFLKKSS